MAFDEKLCQEKHRGIAASLGRVWWALSTASLFMAGSIGYAVVQATEAHNTAIAAKVHAESSDVKLDKILDLLEEKRK
jgi:hypothetical protein